MNTYETFLQKRMEVGSGMMAKVYSYNGYAYKCFNDGYPKEWIDYEYKNQKEIMKSGLPIPRYYESEFPNSIKMDLINGVSMYEKIANSGIDTVMAEMMIWFRRIHEVKGLDLKNFSKYILDKINEAPISNEEKACAKQCYLDVDREISEPEVLCHMDYHFLNVMYEGNNVQIIDWVNAKNGKAIWDYARTYVIYYEHASGIKTHYLKEVISYEKYPKEIFMKAVYVSAIHRLTEHDTKRVRQLVKNALIMK